MTDNIQSNTTSVESKVFSLIKMDKSRRRWRFFAIIFFLISLVLYSSVKSNITKEVKVEDYIAEIKIEGIILEDDYRLQKLEDLKNDESVKAVILTIDSPGGSMVPGLELLDHLRELGTVKPLVVQMKTIAASAGFLISLSGDYVVANKATLTGSIGVMMPLVDATGLAKKIGVKSAEVTSGDLKSITSPLSTRSRKAQTYLQSTVDDLYEIFIDEVKVRRELSPEVEKVISDGRVIIGQQALSYKLIDAIGSKKLLKDYLVSQKEIPETLKIKEYSLEKEEKRKFKDIIADELVSKASMQLNQVFQSYISTPKMIAN